MTSTEGRLFFFISLEPHFADNGGFDGKVFAEGVDGAGGVNGHFESEEGVFAAVVPDTFFGHVETDGVFAVAERVGRYGKVEVVGAGCEVVEAVEVVVVGTCQRVFERTDEVDIEVYRLNGSTEVSVGSFS